VFTEFFDKSSKLLLKAIENPSPTLLEELLQEDGLLDIRKEEKLCHMAKFYDSHFSAGRVVTAVDWSPHLDSGNTVLAAYSKKFDCTIKDEVGVVLVWSLSMKSRPEFFRFSQSEVTAAKFYPFSNHEILGGCYNGQLVLWDLRAKTIPVLRTALADKGHKFPVYSTAVVGTNISHSIVSASNDGLVCTWDLKNFNEPITSE
jgi:dynein intermediate chain